MRIWVLLKQDPRNLNLGDEVNNGTLEKKKEKEKKTKKNPKILLPGEVESKDCRFRRQSRKSVNTYPG